MRFGLVVLMMLIISGCASYHAQRTDLSSQVDVWLEQHQYQRILSTLEALKADHPDFDSLRARETEVVARSQIYRRQMLVQADSLASEDNWVAAVGTLDRAISNLGGDDALAEQRDLYEQARRQSIARSEAAILLSRAEYLIASRASEETLLRANPEGFRSIQRYRTFNIEVQQTATALVAMASNWQDNGNQIAAMEALILSNRLMPKDETRARLNELSRQERATRPPPKQASDNGDEVWSDLELSLQQALRMNDLAAARLFSNEMQALDQVAARPSQQMVEARIESQGLVLLERGRLLYSQGFLQEALAVWQEALRFKPDDPELQASAERAETFLRNLDRWGE